MTEDILGMKTGAVFAAFAIGPVLQVQPLRLKMLDLAQQEGRHFGGPVVSSAGSRCTVADLTAAMHRQAYERPRAIVNRCLGARGNTVAAAILRGNGKQVTRLDMPKPQWRAFFHRSVDHGFSSIAFGTAGHAGVCAESAVTIHRKPVGDRDIGLRS